MHTYDVCATTTRISFFLGRLNQTRYAWWNLIDIAEMYLELQVDDRDIIQRIGNGHSFARSRVYTSSQYGAFTCILYLCFLFLHTHT